MHYVKVKGILSAKNGMNLYRGCSMGVSIVIQEAVVIEYYMILKILKSKKMLLNY